jgi:hypothetical protein
MRIKVEMFKGNGDVEDNCDIHVDTRLSREFLMYEGPDDEGILPTDKKPEYVSDIFGIEGVTTVCVDQYKLSLSKGSVYSWDEILPAVIDILKSAIDPNGQLVRQQDKITTTGFADTDVLEGE